MSIVHIVRDDGNGYFEVILDGVMYCGVKSSQRSIEASVRNMEATRKSVVLSNRIAEATPWAIGIERHIRECFLASWLAACDANPETKPSVAKVFNDAVREVRHRMFAGEDPASKVLGEGVA